MELTRKEETRNKKISVGVTLFSFLVLVLFLLFKNIITPNPSVVNSGFMEVSMSTPNENGNNTGKKSPTLLANKEESSSQKKETTVPNGEIMSVKNNGNDLSVKENPKNTVTENNFLVPTINKERDAKPDSETKFGFNIPGRTITLSPKVVSDTKEEGKVVVEIVVDKNGTVIEASPNGRGTTTNSAALKNKAKEMASATKFSVDERLEEQRGTITIIFSFN